MNKKLIVISICFLTFLFQSATGQQINQTNIQPSSKDVFALSSNPTYPYYTQSYFSAYVYANSSTTYTRRSFVDFDISGYNIPSNAIITSAYIKLYRYSGEANPSLEFSRITESWLENDVTWNDQPSVALNDAVVSNPTVNGGFHIYDITSQVQNYINYPNLTYGWRIRCNNENPPAGQAYGTHYYSKEYGNSLQRPILEINWVHPLNITLQSLTHATSSSINDGSISVDVSGGDGFYNYQWIDGATGINILGADSSNINGLAPGWYGVKVTDNLGNISYMAFIVGAKCETVQIEFDPGPNFIDDAMIYNLVKNGIDYGETYNGGLSTVVPRSEKWTNGSWYQAKSLVRFNIEISQDLQIDVSDFYIYGTGNHWNHTGTNESEANRLIDDWEEHIVTYDSAPSFTTANQILLPQTASSSQNDVLDLNNFFTYWQQNPTENYGFIFQLQNPGPDEYRRRHYYSSDHSTGTLPKIEFEVFVACPSKRYTELQRKLDGGHYNSKDNILCFIHREEYLDTDGLLSFKVLDYQGSEILTSANQNIWITPGYNEVDLDVSSLSSGFYVLEVTNEKNEKLKLRFKK